MLLQVNKSYIYTEIDIYYVNIYIEYIIDLLKSVIIENDLQINIILGNYNFTFNNGNNIIKMNINWEHTLVKKNGRGITTNCLEGKVLTNNGEPYLVRIDRLDELNTSDVIIDYSIPNIYNIYTCNQYDYFKNKLLYISPTLFEYNLQNYDNKQRQLNILTTFINTNESRRKSLLENIKLSNLDHKNINNCFSNNDLKNLYLNTKILINIHQTEHHHTFEELRVLPALLSGVIVISENSPLNNLIPYNDFIIWSTYDNIIETVKNVINNYEYFYNKIFKNTKILSILHKNNTEKLKSKLKI